MHALNHAVKQWETVLLGEAENHTFMCKIGKKILRLLQILAAEFVCVTEFHKLTSHLSYGDLWTLDF